MIFFKTKYFCYFRIIYHFCCGSNRIECALVTVPFKRGHCTGFLALFIIKACISIWFYVIYK